jgi:hypothetical protein
MSKELQENYLESGLIDLRPGLFKTLILSPLSTFTNEDNLLELIIHWYQNNLVLMNNDQSLKTLVSDLLSTKLKWNELSEAFLLGIY